MGQHFQTTDARVTLYLGENEHWLNVLHAQVNEIPTWQQLLNNHEAAFYNRHERNLFTDAFAQQQARMQQLNNALQEQQQRLENDAAEHSLYDVAALQSQDILRAQIQTIEKQYVDLKCSFLQFMSAAV